MSLNIQPIAIEPAPASHGFAFSRPLPTGLTVLAMKALRLAALTRFSGPAPEWVSGHDAGGGVTRDRRHIVWSPIFEEGRLAGAAALFPPGVSDHQRRMMARLLCDVRSVRIDGSSIALDAGGVPFARASMAWVSVTPVSCYIHPDRAKRTVRNALARMCRDAGFPEPAEATFLDMPACLVGTPAYAKRFYLRHAFLRFPAPVNGPVAIGGLRYFGGGAFAPID